MHCPSTGPGPGIYPIEPGSCGRICPSSRPCKDCPFDPLPKIDFCKPLTALAHHIRREAADALLALGWCYLVAAITVVAIAYALVGIALAVVAWPAGRWRRRQPMTFCFCGRVIRPGEQCGVGRCIGGSL